jgi:hypothetical protein
MQGTTQMLHSLHSTVRTPACTGNAATAAASPASRRPPRATVLRLVVVALAFWMENAFPVWAGTTSASFQVGITIGGSGHAATASATTTDVRYTQGAARLTLLREGYTDATFVTQSGGSYIFASNDGSGALQLAVSTTTGELLAITR